MADSEKLSTFHPSLGPPGPEGARGEITVLERACQHVRRHVRRQLPSAAVQAGVLIVLTRQPEDPRIILTRRPEQMRSYGGAVVFPGGKRARGDATLAATALRETEEEIGIKACDIELVGALDDIFSPRGVRITPFMAVVAPQVRLAANPDEVETIFRVPLSELTRPGALAFEPFELDQRELKMPVWRYQGHTIWGLTAIMLADFLNVAGQGHFVSGLSQALYGPAPGAC